MAERKLLKVLVVHGYRQNASSSRLKTGAFRKGLKKYIDCVFITAPNVIPGGSSDENEECGWWFSKRDESSVLSFNALELSDIEDGHQQSVDLIRKTCKEQGPFDGILGFSQGATMVAHICALAQNDTDFSFKFAIICAGFKSRSSLHEKFNSEGEITMPSLHVFGDTDQVIAKEMSLGLVKCFSDATLLNHGGGHFIPAGSAEKKQYQAFLDRFNK